MTGRPSTYTPEMFDEICRLISTGETLSEICRTFGVGRRTVHDWMAKDEALAAQFARARSEGFDAIADGILSILDEPPPITPMGSTDSGHVSWQKLRVDGRLKLLSKWDPKRYGDKLELAGDANAPLAIQVVQYSQGEKPK